MPWKKMAVSVVVLLSLIGLTSWAQESGADESLVKAGMNKARSLGKNPIPAFVGDKGTIIVVAGAVFSIRGGRWTLVEGDMLINVGEKPLPADGLRLLKGEYAIVKGGEIKKQSGKVTDSGWLLFPGCS